MSEQATCPCGKKAAEACAAAKASTPASASASQNGKGDAPRNISAKFRKNYDSIRWTEVKKSKPGKKFVKVY